MVEISRRVIHTMHSRVRYDSETLSRISAIGNMTDSVGSSEPLILMQSEMLRMELVSITMIFSVDSPSIRQRSDRKSPTPMIHSLDSSENPIQLPDLGCSLETIPMISELDPSELSRV